MIPFTICVRHFGMGIRPFSGCRSMPRSDYRAKFWHVSCKKKKRLVKWRNFGSFPTLLFPSKFRILDTLKHVPWHLLEFGETMCITSPLLSLKCNLRDRTSWTVLLSFLIAVFLCVSFPFPIHLVQRVAQICRLIRCNLE